MPWRSIPASSSRRAILAVFASTIYLPLGPFFCLSVGSLPPSLLASFLLGLRLFVDHMLSGTRASAMRDDGGAWCGPSVLRPISSAPVLANPERWSWPSSREARRLLLAAGEEAPNHVGGDVAGQAARVEGAAGHVGGLAELVAAGEGEGVHDG